MPKESRSNASVDSDVIEILESAAQTGSTAWVTEELAGVDLGDDRLSRRLHRTVELLAGHPTAPINNACPDWASTKATYRLFDNSKASPAAILEPHIRATVRRMESFQEPLLAVQDTVFVSYKTHKKVEEIGPIGKDDSDRGLIMHNALVLTSSGGVPIGLLSQQIWARQEIPEETQDEKVKRLRNTRIEKKESYKWIRGLRETVERAPPNAHVITMGDREIDFFEFLTCAEEIGAQYLIRAKRDRRLEPGEDDEDDYYYECITDALAAAEVLGTMPVPIPGNSDRKARVAEVAIKSVKVTIKAPQRHGQAKESGSTEPVTVTVISATETSLPEDAQTAVSWVLFTNLLVPSFDSAAEKVRWYAKRFTIETWHKVLKSGCLVEDCRLRKGKRLSRYLALFSIIGVRLMYVAYLARALPDAPAATLLSDLEIQALHLQVHGELPPAEQEPPSLREAIRMLGRLGGHLGRKCDKEPGMTVVWRGWPRLYDTVRALSALCKGAHLRLRSGGALAG